MSKRLQVVLNDAELVEIQRAARREHLTTAAWVRQALRVARRSVPETAAKKKLAVVQSATHHAFPTGDVGQMLREFERGYLSDEP